jgi:hypothetical protein
MIDEDKTADELIHAQSKRSRSYHGSYGGKTYREIKRLASARPPDMKARQMKKLIEENERLRQKQRKPRG